MCIPLEYQTGALYQHQTRWWVWGQPKYCTIGYHTHCAFNEWALTSFACPLRWKREWSLKTTNVKQANWLRKWYSIVTFGPLACLSPSFCNSLFSSWLLFYLFLPHILPHWYPVLLLSTSSLMFSDSLFSKYVTSMFCLQNPFSSSDTTCSCRFLLFVANFSASKERPIIKAELHLAKTTSEMRGVILSFKNNQETDDFFFKLKPSTFGYAQSS